MSEAQPQGTAKMIKTWNDMSFMEKMEMVRKLMGYPALTLLIFIRDRPGYRSLNGTDMLMMAALMEVVGQISRDGAICIIAPVMLALGMFRRRIEWESIRRGERWHTRSLGVSYLGMLPVWPEFFRKENRLQRQYEPLFYLLIGLVVQHFDFTVGLWLVVSSVGLWAVEESIHEVAISRALDLLDSLIEGEVHEENIQHFSGGANANAAPGTVTPLPLKETAGIPTGIGQDIAAQIERRRRRDAEKREARAVETGTEAGEKAAEGVRSE